MKRYARHGHGLWLVLDKANGQPVGQAGLLIQNVEGVEEKEVGYLIHRPSWRRGFATEAARACLDHAFNLLGRQQVISLIRPENLPSQGVARKLGMMPGPSRLGRVISRRLSTTRSPGSAITWARPLWWTWTRTGNWTGSSGAATAMSGGEAEKAGR